jgi:hypothetical protein
VWSDALTTIAKGLPHDPPARQGAYAGGAGRAGAGANGEIKLYAPMDSMLELIAEVRRLRAENSCLRMDVIQLLPQKDED